MISLPHFLSKRNFLLLFLSMFCLMLSAVRIYFSGNIVFIFLVWNLFLAAVPYAVSSVLSHSEMMKKSSILFIWISLFWILFLPNAPYLLTDLMHLHSRPIIPVWYDAFLLGLYAFTGIILFVYSLLDMETIWLEKFGKRKTMILLTTTCFLTSFGIYLGRFKRWNSWDLVQNPLGLAQDLAARVLFPHQHWKSWAITLLYGTFLIIVYQCFKNFSKAEATKNNF